MLPAGGARRWVGAGAAIVVGAAAAFGGDEPTADLTWKLQLGQRFAVRTQQTTSTRTVLLVQGEKIVETVDENTDRVRVLEVVDLYDEGNVEVMLSMRSLLYERDNGTIKTRMETSNGPDGEPVVKVKVDAVGSDAMAGLMRPVIEDVARTVHGLRFRVVAGPDGRIVRARTLEDFRPAKGGTSGAFTSAQVMQWLGSGDEVADSVASEIFLQVPGRPVELKATWPILHKTSSAGIGMDGKGTGTFVAQEDREGDEPLGMLYERTTYALDVSAAAEEFRRSMEAVVGRLPTGVDLKSSLRPRRPVALACTTIFDPVEGRVVSRTWRESKFGLNGKVEVKGPGGRFSAIVTVDVTTKTSVTWEPVE